MSVTITKTVLGDTPSSVVLASLTRRDTGAPANLDPALPQNFTAEGAGAYSITASDLGGDCPQGYRYGFTLNWSDGSNNGPYFGNTPAGGGAPSSGGALQTAVDALVQLVSSTPYFQAWVGAGSPSQALDSIYTGEVGYPIVSAAIAGGVLTITTREPCPDITASLTVTLAGASIGAEASIDIDGQQTVIAAVENTLTFATGLPDAPAWYPDQAFIMPGVRPLAVVCEAGSNSLHSEIIGTGGANVKNGSLEILIEADVSAPCQNNSANALIEARSAAGAFKDSLDDTSGTGDLMVTNKSELVSGPEFTTRSSQDSNRLRFERWRATFRVEWGLTG
jgi:hypothetical protein